jgi:hypothetical protein
MAPRKKRDETKTLEASQKLNVFVRLEPVESAATYYVNHIEVGNSPQDFTLLCGRMPGKLTPAKLSEVKELDGALIIEPEVQLIIPTALVPGLIRALTAQKETYEKNFGVELREIAGVTDEASNKN